MLYYANNQERKWSLDSIRVKKKNLVRIQLDNVVKLLDGEMQEQLVIDSRGFTKKRIIITYGGDNETTIGL